MTYSDDIYRLRERERRMFDYVSSLSLAIFHHCRGETVPEEVAKQCPYHAEMLNDRLKELEY